MHNKGGMDLFTHNMNKYMQVFKEVLSNSLVLGYSFFFFGPLKLSPSQLSIHCNFGLLLTNELKKSIL